MHATTHKQVFNFSGRVDLSETALEGQLGMLSTSLLASDGGVSLTLNVSRPPVAGSCQGGQRASASGLCVDVAMMVPPLRGVADIGVPFDTVNTTGTSTMLIGSWSLFCMLHFVGMRHSRALHHILLFRCFVRMRRFSCIGPHIPLISQLC